ncbi:MAG: ABC transporter permease [Saprospiraceae bacterium]
MNMEQTRKIKVIKNEVLGSRAYLNRCWEYRHLLIGLAKRDIKAKYAQAVLGILWSLLKPLTGLAVFTLFFDNLMKVNTHEIPYPVFAFTGLTSWYFFTYIISSGGTSLMESQGLLKKVYFPKLIMPLSKVLVGFLDFALSFILLIGLMVLSGYGLRWQIVFLPLFIILNMIAGLSVAIWLSALTIRYRDFYHIIPYLVNFSIWLTPVFYPGTLIPETYNWALYINPMAGVIAGFRWALLGDVFPSVYYLVSFAFMIILLVSGFFYFKMIEKEIADLI